jgi:hypothetical protein
VNLNLLHPMCRRRSGQRCGAQRNLKDERGCDCESLYAVEHHVGHANVLLQLAQCRCRIPLISSGVEQGRACNGENIHNGYDGRNSERWSANKIMSPLNSELISWSATIMSLRFSSAEIMQGIQIESNRRTKCTVKSRRPLLPMPSPGGIYRTPFDGFFASEVV